MHCSPIGSTDAALAGPAPATCRSAAPAASRSRSPGTGVRLRDEQPGKEVVDGDAIAFRRHNAWPSDGSTGGSSCGGRPMPKRRLRAVAISTIRSPDCGADPADERFRGRRQRGADRLNERNGRIGSLQTASLAARTAGITSVARRSCCSATPGPAAMKLKAVKPSSMNPIRRAATASGGSETTEGRS
jgi:hypothetical protein